MGLPSRTKGTRLAMLSVIAALPMFAACAQVVVKPASSTNAEGLHFYRPTLYLHFFNDKDGVCTVKVVPLPDYSQEWLVTTDAGIGSAEANATLSDGWNLTALGAKADTKVAETITGLAALATAVRPAQALPRKGVPPKGCDNPPPGFYAIVKSETSPELIQLEPIVAGVKGETTSHKTPGPGD